jgi:hypothetical protein
LQTDPLLLRDSEGGKTERASDMWDQLERVKKLFITSFNVSGVGQLQSSKHVHEL